MKKSRWVEIPRPGPAKISSMTETPRHEVTLRFLAAPTDQGHSGTVDAGRVLEWVDKAAFAAATAWAGTYCVTAYVGNIHFREPVTVGQMVEVTASVLYTGSSSMHINTVVRSGDPKTGELSEATRCLVVFVAVEDGKPVKVPEFVPRSLEQELAREYAISRIAVRDEITAAYLCATRWAGRDTVAVFSGGVRFYRPLNIGDLVEVEARLIYTGNKGMHVAARPRPARDPREGPRQPPARPPAGRRRVRRRGGRQRVTGTAGA